MSQGFLVPLPNRLFTVAGVPADGYLIYTYVAGTLTPLTTYSDAGLSSSNTNPIQAAADGYFRMFVAAGVLIKIAVHDAADSPLYTFDNIEPMVDPTSSSPSVTAVPPGGMIFYGGSAAPSGFLLCDGSLVSRATYATLFGILGTTFGAGDGLTTFGLPDMRGKFPLGVAASGTGSTRGGTGGLIDHVHTGPSHTHVVTVPRDGWGATLNAPSQNGRLNTGAAAGAGQFSSSYQPTADIDVTSAAGGTGDTGTANPPFLAGLWIIKT